MEDKEFQEIYKRCTTKYQNGFTGIILPTFILNPVDMSNKIIEAPIVGEMYQMLNDAQDPKQLRQVRKLIKTKLDTKIKFRIPRDLKIDKNILKNVAQIPRSTIEPGADRANFIIECRKWEASNQEEDQFYWTDRALEVLSTWVGNAREDKVEMENLYQMCLILFVDKIIPTDSKLDITSAFYLVGAINYCYELYNVILACPYTRLNDRAECCKFLYHSGITKYKPAIEMHINSIIESDANDDVRYETIACFVTNTGVASRYLSHNLQVDQVDQTLISKLFLKFIQTKPDHFYTIMASEFLLEQTVFGNASHCDSCKFVDQQKGLLSAECECGAAGVWGYADIKPLICQRLLEIAMDTTLDERTRADAADVLINHENEPFTQKARDIIHEIGESGQSEIEKNIYTNKENVHLINDTFKTFIETNHKKFVGSFLPIDQICVQIEDVAADFQTDDLFKIRKSIDRIMLETTLHTKRKVSTSEIFRMVWFIIRGHSKCDELTRRFIEELIDMSDTCSSGHVSRLINVMVGFDDSLEGSINISDQLVANIKARIMATIRYSPDSEMLLESMIGKDEERDLFLTHVETVLPGIDKELRSEFIEEGWLSEKRYKIIFNDTKF